MGKGVEAGTGEKGKNVAVRGGECTSVWLGLSVAEEQHWPAGAVCLMT